MAILRISLLIGCGVNYATAFVADPPGLASPLRARYRQLKSVTGLFQVRDESTSKLYAIMSDRDEPAPSQILSRQKFVHATIASAATILNPSLRPQTANADEPNNVFYKSKADEEDPLAVFGKSLQNANVDASNGTSGTSAKDALSFSDIALPSSSDTTSPAAPPMGGDLGKALKEKKESQKRSVDPRTHG